MIKDEDKPEIDIKLTVKQRRFVEEYCKDFNATQAAIRSGYSEHSAFLIGWENLRKPAIKDLIDIRISALTMSAAATDRNLDYINLALAFNVSDPQFGVTAGEVHPNTVGHTAIATYSKNYLTTNNITL